MLHAPVIFEERIGGLTFDDECLMKSFLAAADKHQCWGIELVRNDCPMSSVEK